MPSPLLSWLSQSDLLCSPWKLGNTHKPNFLGHFTGLQGRQFSLQLFTGPPGLGAPHSFTMDPTTPSHGYEHFTTCPLQPTLQRYSSYSQADDSLSLHFFSGSSHNTLQATHFHVHFLYRILEVVTSQALCSMTSRPCFSKQHFCTSNMELPFRERWLSWSALHGSPLCVLDFSTPVPLQPTVTLPIL